MGTGSQSEEPEEGLAELLLRNRRGDFFRYDEPPIGLELGDVKIIRRVGNGAFGVVFQGVDSRLDRQVAVKFLAQEFRSSPEHCRRFTEEARNVAKLGTCRNVAAIYSAGVWEQTPYFVMEYLEGPSFREHLDKVGPLSLEAFGSFAHGLLGGLDEIHGQGMVHRDIKPENLVFDGGGELKLVDLGLAYALGSTGRGQSRAGTLGYMAPEVETRGCVDARADLYSAGMVLYESLTGHLPEPGGKVRTALREQQPDVPDEVIRLIKDALATDPEARPASARRMLQRMQEMEQRRDHVGHAQTLLLQDVGTSGGWRPWIGWFVLALTIAAVAVVVILSVRGPDPKEGKSRGAPAQGTVAAPAPAPAAKPRLSIKDGILLATTASEGTPARQAYEALCQALGGDRQLAEPRPLPVHCTIVPAAGFELDRLMDRAERRGARLLIHAGANSIHIRATSHGRIAPLLSQFSELELPTDAHVKQLVPVVKTLAMPWSDSVVAVEPLDADHVGLRWAIVAEAIRAAREVDDPSANPRLDHLTRHCMLRLGANSDACALARLLRATNMLCRNVEDLQALANARGAYQSIGTEAHLALAACLVDGKEVPAADLRAAERRVADVLIARGHEACVIAEAASTVAAITRAGGDDDGTLWKRTDPEQLDDPRCPRILANAMAARADVLAFQMQWCDAADGFANAYRHWPDEPVWLLNWAEYAMRCPDPTRGGSALPAALNQALRSRHDTPTTISLAYLWWRLHPSPTRAQTVANAFDALPEGAIALLDGVGTSFADRIGTTKHKVQQLLSRPKHPEDLALLRRALGLRPVRGRTTK